MTDCLMEPSKSTVLVVDDRPENLSLVSELLTGQYKVQVASSGARALKIASGVQPPDLILLDVMMPELDGYETCRQLRAGAAGRVPIIFLSALSSADERLRGYASGGDDYVCKPFDPAELMAKIERQLSAAALRRELEVQLDEVMGAVLNSADMVGEIGVVLAFQRRLNECAGLEPLAQALFEALASYGLEGCVRMVARSGACSFNSKGPCSALERSILDHVQAQSVDPRIQPFGQHSSFHFGNVVLFVRNLPMARSAEMDAATSDRHGRAIDNVALLLEGACARVSALDSEIAVRDLQAVRRLVGMTGDTLAEVAARNRALTAEVQQVFEQLVERVELSFISLGLTPRQEDMLGGLLRQSAGNVLGLLSRGKEDDALLSRVTDELRRVVA